MKLNLIPLLTLFIDTKDQSLEEAPLEWKTIVTPVLLVGNIVIFIVLWCVFWLKNVAQSLCLSPVWGVAILSVGSLSLLHVVWRVLYPSIHKIPKFSLNLKMITIDLSGEQINALHPIKLKFLVLVTLLGIAALFLLLSRIYPGLPSHIQEPLPIIDYFSVTDQTTRKTRIYNRGETVRLTKGSQLSISVNTQENCATSCAWETITGNAFPKKGRSTLYTPSPSDDKDSLTIVMHSPCKTFETTATLFIDATAHR